MMLDASATIPSCSTRQRDAAQLQYKNMRFNIGANLTLVDNAQHICAASVTFDPAAASSSSGSMPEYIRIQYDAKGSVVQSVTPIAVGALPAWARPLIAATFPAPGNAPLSYDATDSLSGSSSSYGTCFSLPGPADVGMQCVLTSGGTWVGYRWYRFVDQPGLQRLGLSAAQQTYMQGRIERLHAALAASSPLNRWAVFGSRGEGCTRGFMRAGAGWRRKGCTRGVF